jgi:hypothetical protein
VYRIDTVYWAEQGAGIVKIPLYFITAGACLCLVLAAPVAAKPVRHDHPATAQGTNHSHPDRRYAQSYYNYRSQSMVREEFRDIPDGHWMHARRDRYAQAYRERRDGLVVENLRDTFSGGVGYGADGFTDGYGQTHYFVGSFRQMNPLPHGPFRPGRVAPMSGPRRF